MAEIIRVPPAEVREKVKSGQVILVCAYPDEERFKSLRLEGAISFQEFESRLPSQRPGDHLLLRLTPRSKLYRSGSKICADGVRKCKSSRGWC